jgi:hypothetical protein
MGFECDNIHDQTPLKSFDAQLTSLDLKFTFGMDIPKWLISAMSADSHAGNLNVFPWSAPYIGHISVHGPSESVIACILSLCTRRIIGVDVQRNITVEILSPALDPSINDIFHQSLPVNACHDGG